MAKKKKEGERTSNMKEVLEEVTTVLHEATAAPPPEDVDYDQALAELDKTLADLRDQTEALYGTLGLTREEVDEYTHNPDNFSKEEWEMLEQVRGELTAIEAGADEALKTATDDREGAQKRARRKGRLKKWLKS